MTASMSRVLSFSISVDRTNGKGQGEREERERERQGEICGRRMDQVAQEISDGQASTGVLAPKVPKPESY